MLRTIIPKQQFPTRIIIKADAEKRKEIVEKLAHSFSQQLDIFLEKEGSTLYQSDFEKFMNGILPGLKVKVEKLPKGSLGRSHFGVAKDRFILAFKELNQKCNDMNNFKDDISHEVTHLFQSSLLGNPAQRLGEDIKQLHYDKKGFVLFRNKKYDKLETEITKKCGELYYRTIYKPETAQWIKGTEKEQFREAVLKGLEQNGITNNHEKIHHLRFFYKSVLSEAQAHGDKQSAIYEFAQKAEVLKEELTKALKKEVEYNSNIYPKGKSGIL